MKKLRAIAMLGVLVFLSACASDADQVEPAPITGQLSEKGYGPIRIGEPLPADVPLAWFPDLDLIDSYEDYSSCHYVGVDTVDGRIWIMLRQEVAVRFDIRGQGIRLANGLGIGSSSADIILAYGDVAVSHINFYAEDDTDIDYVVPISEGQGAYFELSDNQVLTFRVGRFPELRMIEGCS